MFTVLDTNHCGKVAKDSLCIGVIFMGSLDEANRYSITIQGNLLKVIGNWLGVVTLPWTAFLK